MTPDNKNFYMHPGGNLDAHSQEGGVLSSQDRALVDKLDEMKGLWKTGGLSPEEIERQSQIFSENHGLGLNESSPSFPRGEDIFTTSSLESFTDTPTPFRPRLSRQVAELVDKANRFGISYVDKAIQNATEAAERARKRKVIMHGETGMILRPIKEAVEYRELSRR